MGPSSLMPIAAAAVLAMVVILLQPGPTLTANVAPSNCSLNRPNIIFILVDDAGWDDFMSHDKRMVTRNIRKLRRMGVFLNQSYMLPMCAPTRSALMSGRYPHTFGAQNGKAAGTDKKFWVNETFNFISDEMKELDYTTHMLGKWHLGFCHPSLTPLGRGFDTFYGMMLGAHNSYYTHYKTDNGPYDWWDGNKIDLKASGKYNTELLSDRAAKIIKETNATTSPFFMYLAYPAPHGPKEVPDKYIDQYCPLENFAVNETDEIRARRIHCGMMVAVDRGIWKITKALEDKNMFDNTVILLMSDNGGAVGHGASNHPLRGGKKTVYEGGTRVYSVLKAPCLESRKFHKGLIHAVDWMPTLVTMAGGQVKPYMHGYNMWDSIRDNTASPRTEMLYTRDDYYKFNHSAYRWRQWKVIQNKPGFDLGWYPPSYTGPTIDVKKNYNASFFEFYNVEDDPEEKHDLFGDPAYEAFFQRTLKKRDRFMAKYKLQPFKESEKSEAWKNTTTNLINTCWCNPRALRTTANVHHQPHEI